MTNIELAAVTYAFRFSLYCGGSHYGQDGGLGPNHNALTAEQASYVHAAVSRGMNVASAEIDGDAVGAEHHGLEFNRSLVMAQRFAGLDANTMRAAFKAGYNRIESIRAKVS